VAAAAAEPVPAASLLVAELGPGIQAGFTRRPGGRSKGAWAGLNLGLHVGDDLDRVADNRRLVQRWVGAPVAFGRQVHGTNVRLVTDADAGLDLDRTDLGRIDPESTDPESTDPEGGCDALVTSSRVVAVGVLVADCVPVLLADPVAGVVGAAHAGRRGLLDGVLERAVQAMTGQGATPARIRAALGPAACGCCYEVPQELQDEACAVLPSLRARTTWGTPSLDLRAGCRSELERLGLAEVALVGGCAIEDDAGFSYRRAQVTGRFAGVVRRLP